MSFAHFTPATAQELAAIDQRRNPQGPPNPPERIHGWLNTQLSLARHYGGCTYQGRDYVIAVNEPGQPLVRVDVLQAEAKAKLEADKAAKAARKQDAQAAQGGLL